MTNQYDKYEDSVMNSNQDNKLYTTIQGSCDLDL
jgi:hypothetical protein